MKVVVAFILLALSACAPSQSSIQTAIARTDVAQPTPTKSTPGGCTYWLDVAGPDLLKADRMCIYGDLYDQREIEDENGATFVVIRFSYNSRSLYILQEYPIHAARGDCITAVGSISRDKDLVQYMNVDSVVEKC